MKLFRIFIVLFLLFGVVKTADNSNNLFKVATSAGYVPFEFLKNGEYQGFDMDIGREVAKRLGLKFVVVDGDFSSIFANVEYNRADVAISSLNSTKEREKNFTFSIPYYYEDLAVIYKKSNPIKNLKDMENKTITVALGSNFEAWLKVNSPKSKKVNIDTTPAIEGLKAGHYDGVMSGLTAAKYYVEKNKDLSYTIVGKDVDGIKIMAKKNSELMPKINKAIEDMKLDGTISNLEKKWFVDFK